MLFCLPGQIIGILIEHIDPALDRHFAVLGIDPDGNFLGSEGIDQLRDESGFNRCPGADDDAGHSDIKCLADILDTAHATAQLDLDPRFQNPLHRFAVGRGSVKGTVQIDHVDPLGSGLTPAAGRRTRILKIHRLGIGTSLK